MTEHLAKHLDREGKVFRYKVSAELTSSDLEVIGSLVADLFKRIKDVLPVDISRTEKTVLIGCGVVVVEVERLYM